MLLGRKGKRVTMQITAISNIEKREHADCLVLPFWKGEKGAEAACDLGKLTAYSSLPIKVKDFTGKEGEVLWVYGSEPEESRIALLGLGNREGITIEKLRRAYGALTKAVLKRKCSSLSFLFPNVDLLNSELVAKAIGEGFFLANYVFDALKHDTLKQEPTVRITKVQCITSDQHAVLDALMTIEKTAKGVYLARDLTNGNADDITPQYLGRVAKQLESEYPTIEATVHDRDWIEKQGMGLLLAVGKGSEHPPVFIVAKYKGNPTSSDHTVIVGKGLTFDTGGLNLKPKGNIESQRVDMAGAAVALGTIKALAELSLPVNVTAVIASCENAISSKSYKPGDVYKAYSGKTVEITDTDAEGRLTLADALSWTVKNLQPTRVIDFATLTGSMVVALGSEVFGLMSNSDSLAQALLHSGEKTHERAWQLPLFEEYKEYLKSEIADIKNSAGREGGAILAAIFLQEFVGNTPWAHFDIAGVAFQKEGKRYYPKMATGIGIRLMIDYIESLIPKAQKGF
ncbi:MAG: pepA [Chlamydiia bacterium]|nr:pepA [Chlamydiia bacterium]